MTSYEELIFRIKADNSGMGNPLAPFQTDIDETSRELAGLQAQLDTLDNDSVSVDIDVRQDALTRLRREVARIRDEIAEAKVINIHADTTEASAMVAALQRQIRALSDPPEKKAKVDVDADGMFSKEFAQLAARSGVQFISFFVKAIQSAGPTGGPAIAAALGGVIGAALAAVGSTTVLAGGLGILTAGIVSAFQDPDIVAAASAPAQAMAASFRELGDGLGAPIVRALETIQTAIAFMSDTLEPVMNEMGGIIELFGDKAGEAIEILSVAFAVLGRGAGPVLTTFANELPSIAKAIEVVFVMLSTQSEGAALALKLMLEGVQAVILGIGLMISVALLPFTAFIEVVQFLSREWDKMTIGMKKLYAIIAPGIAFAAWLGSVVKMGSAAEDTSGEVENLTEAEERNAMITEILAERQREAAEAYKVAQAAAKEAAEAASAYFGTQFGLLSTYDTAIMDALDGWGELNEALEDGARTFDINTKAGRDNRRAVLTQLENIKAERDAYIALGGSILQANDRYLGQIVAIEANADALGFNSKELDGLVAKYEALPEQQLVEIRTAWASSANPDLARAELEKEFGVPVVQEILAGVDHDSVKLAKAFFGSAFGDPVQERVFAKIDPEGYAELQEDLDAIGGADTETVVKIKALEDGPSFDAITDKLRVFEQSTPKPKVTPFMSIEAYDAVTNQLNTLQTTRYVMIKPYLDPDAVRNVNAGLVGNAPGEGNRPIKPGENVAAGTSRQTVNVYLDGEAIRAAFRGEINAGIERATVAATSYRRL